jgi:hypothetical protein
VCDENDPWPAGVVGLVGRPVMRFL